MIHLISQGIGMLEISINLTGNQSKIYPNILTNEEAQRALKSLKKLTNFDIENIICYHGSFYNNDANNAIEKLLETFE